MQTINARIILSLFASILCVEFAPVHAQRTYSLNWSRNPEPDIIAYRVHVGTSSREYDRVYLASSNSIVISDLPEGPTYFFSVTALNWTGMESSFSEETSTGGSSSSSPLSTSISGSAVTLRVPASAGTTVVFESSTDLRTWSYYASATANAQGTAIFSQPRSSLAPARFFRVRLP